MLRCTYCCCNHTWRSKKKEILQFFPIQSRPWDPDILVPSHPSLSPGFFLRLSSSLLSVSLQVEQLFCLGLRSRPECLKLLEMCDWNLEVASTQMLDNYGSTTRQRYCTAPTSHVESISLNGLFSHITEQQWLSVHPSYLILQCCHSV